MLYIGGVDVRLGLRSNLGANLTANTDFRGPDVDTQQFNLTPYKLFFQPADLTRASPAQLKRQVLDATFQVEADVATANHV